MQSQPQYVIISREGARYIDAPDWQPVIFPTRAAARAIVPEVEKLVTSGDLPLRVVTADSSSVRA